MFVLYNAALRGFPAGDVDCLLGNKYETTIFVVASGITKLSKVTAVPPNRRLYRGLGGMLLPDQFWRSFSECRATVVARAGSAQQAALSARALTALVLVEQRGVLGSDREMKARVLRLSALAGTSLSEKSIRVVVDAKVGTGNVARMLVALPLSKWELVEDGLHARVADAIRLLLEQAEGGGCAGVAVSLEDLADKPSDFKGGGVCWRLLHVCVPRGDAILFGNLSRFAFHRVKGA